MKVIILVDNIENHELKGEWGLSIFIEHEGVKLLLDTGASNLFVENAKKLGINLNDVDYGVLSHAHYDHANGIPFFFRKNDSAKFYVQQGMSSNCYERGFMHYKYIGIPKDLLSQYGTRFVFVEGVCSLTNNISIVSHHIEQLEEKGHRESMFVKVNGKMQDEDFSHEQSLVIRTQKGLFVFNSCCHVGVETIINEVKDIYPDEHIYGLVGGFHLYNKTRQEIEKLGDYLITTGIEQVYTGHCTGDKAYFLLKKYLKDKLHQFNCGLTLGDV